MTRQVNFSRRNFLTAKKVRTTVSDKEQTFRLDLSERCLTFANVVCEACRDNCATNAIRFPPKLGGAASPLIDAECCTGCGDCIDVCPVNALTLEILDVDPAESEARHD